MNTLRIAIVAGLLTTAAQPAFAHVGAGAVGFAHPFSGIDHILTMLAVGLFASRCGGLARWLVPVAFVAVMVLGGAFGYAGIALPYVEPAIALSVIAMGALLVFDVRLPWQLALPLVGAFALFHGHAHGTEGAQMASFATYALGFVAATALLHATGLGIGEMLERRSAHVAQSGRLIAGLIASLAGLSLLAG